MIISGVDEKTQSKLRTRRKLKGAKSKNTMSSFWNRMLNWGGAKSPRRGQCA